MKHAVLLLILCSCFAVDADLGSNWFSSLQNATSGATNYLSGVVERQKVLLRQVTDTASNYVATAVETPKNILVNMKNITTDYVDSAASKALDNKLKAFLERIRADMPYGKPDSGMPILEPLKIEYQSFEVRDEDMGNFSGFVKDVTISHLSTFVVDQAKFSLSGPNITVNISIPTIHATGLYNISGVIGNVFSLNGTGPFDVTLNGSKLYLNTALGFSQGMYIKSLDSDVSVQTVSIHLQNLMPRKDTGDAICRILGVVAPEAVEEFKPQILPIIQDYVASKANSTIYNLTLQDMIQILLKQV